MQWRIFGFLVFIVIVAGCAGGSGTQITPPPLSYGPLEHDQEVMTKINEIFKETPPLRRNGIITIPLLRSIARKTRSAPVAVFECNIAVFKAFIASNWVPIVVMGPPNGAKHLAAVVGYDDTTQEFIFIEPEDNTQKRIEYGKLFRLLVGRQKMCLLMFPRYTGPASIRRALKNYIPEEKAEKIPVITPRDK